MGCMRSASSLKSILKIDENRVEMQNDYILPA
jgi:hypothetical protein